MFCIYYRANSIIGVGHAKMMSKMFAYGFLQFGEAAICRPWVFHRRLAECRRCIDLLCVNLDLKFWQSRSLIAGVDGREILKLKIAGMDINPFLFSTSYQTFIGSFILSAQLTTDWVREVEVLLMEPPGSDRSSFKYQRVIVRSST